MPSGGRFRRRRRTTTAGPAAPPTESRVVLTPGAQRSARPRTVQPPPHPWWQRPVPGAIRRQAYGEGTVRAGRARPRARAPVAGAGRLNGDGTTPLMTDSRSPRLCTLGIDERRPIVYGARGLTRTWSAVPSSTI